MKRVLVIGATGNIGRPVVSELIASGAGVRALARDPDSANLPAATELVKGDLTDPSTLDPALRDVDAVFLIWRALSTAVAPAVARITESMRRIVFLSAPHRTAHPFFQQPNPVAALHTAIERQIEASGVEWTFLRPGMFALNAINWWAPSIHIDDLVHRPYGEAPTAPIHECEIAAVAVRTLLEEGDARRDYVLTGPESLTNATRSASSAR